MKRGDVVTVATSGDYGKPRPAVIIQTDAFPPTHPSIVIVQFTSILKDADVRVTVEPTPGNGLRTVSQAMADKPTTVTRNRVGAVIGRLSDSDLSRIVAAVALTIGLAG